TELEKGCVGHRSRDPNPRADGGMDGAGLAARPGPSSTREPSLLDGRRDALDLAGLQELVLRGDGALDRRRHLRAPLAVADAADVGAELLVLAAQELVPLGRLDRVVDGDVDTLERARHHPRPEVALVRVDAHAEHVLLVRSVEHAEAAAAGDLELDD